MATSDTVSLTGQQRGPNGGTGFRFEYRMEPGITAPLVDRSVGLWVAAWELATPQGDIWVSQIDCMTEGIEGAYSIRGLGAAGLRTAVLTWVM